MSNWIDVAAEADLFEGAGIAVTPLNLDIAVFKVDDGVFAINNECRKLVEVSNAKENRSRLPQQYSPGDQILILLDADERRGQPKLSVPTRGPFTITAVHTNGTVTINRGNITETINIRRIKPFYS